MNGECRRHHLDESASSSRQAQARQRAASREAQARQRAASREAQARQRAASNVVRAGAFDLRAMQDSARIIVEGVTPVHRRAVVPYHEVTDVPHTAPH